MPNVFELVFSILALCCGSSNTVPDSGEILDLVFSVNTVWVFNNCGKIDVINVRMFAASPLPFCLRESCPC